MACRSLLQVWFLSLIRFVNPFLTSFCVQQSATALQLMMDALCASEDAEAADPLALVLMNATQACPAFLLHLHQVSFSSLLGNRRVVWLHSLRVELARTFHACCLSCRTSGPSDVSASRVPSGSQPIHFSSLLCCVADSTDSNLAFNELSHPEIIDSGVAMHLCSVLVSPSSRLSDDIIGLLPADLAAALTLGEPSRDVRTHAAEALLLLTKSPPGFAFLTPRLPVCTSPHSFRFGR
jgi:hypothetical protein